MTTRVISTPPELFDFGTRAIAAPLEYDRPTRSGLSETTESLAFRGRAARGVLLGILFGAAFYGASLILLGVIKL